MAKNIIYKIIWQTHLRRKLRRSKERYRRIKKKSNTLEYAKYKNAAQNLVENKIGYFNDFYKFNVNKITIKNQKTRWGSCSRKGNLNFNYRLALLPEYLSDYIIVHELCHLGELNHSPKFWDLVAKTIPHYKKIKREFKKIRLS